MCQYVALRCSTCSVQCCITHVYVMTSNPHPTLIGFVVLMHLSGGEHLKGDCTRCVLKCSQVALLVIRAISHALHTHKSYKLLLKLETYANYYCMWHHSCYVRN